jgi:hypothetical protein
MGRGVVAAVNCGRLWGESPTAGPVDANYLVAVTATLRSPQEGELFAFEFFDPAGAAQGLRVVEAAEMAHDWLDAGGQFLATHAMRNGRL